MFAGSMMPSGYTKLLLQKVERSLIISIPRYIARMMILGLYSRDLCALKIA